MTLEMTSDQIFDTIISIGNTSGKNDKVSMIAACSTSEDFKKVLVLGLSPHVNFGIAKRHVFVQNERDGKQFDALTYEILDDLSTRTLSGNAAISAVCTECASLTPASAELMMRIVTKDLKGGFGDSSVNKAIKGLIPDYPYMRCSLPKEAKLDEFDWVQGVFSQEKADGMFFNVDINGVREVALSSRQGSLFPLDELLVMVSVLRMNFPKDVRLNGEVEVERDGVILPREIGNGIMKHVQDGGKFGVGERAILKLWDMMPLGAVVPKGKYGAPYKLRMAGLRKCIGHKSNESCVRIIDTRIVHSLADAYAHYAELLELGKEGTVVKDPNGGWEDATSKYQVKLKLDFAVDLVIVGYEEGNGKNAATFGSIITQTSDGLLRVSVSGFKDKPGIGYLTRSQIWEMKDALIDTVMTVRANGIMKPSSDKKLHSLFLPRFVEFRRDKTTADDLACVFEQYEEAKRNAAIKAENMKKAA